MEWILPDGRTAKVLEFHTKQGSNVFFTGLLNPSHRRTCHSPFAVSIFQLANGLFVRSLGKTKKGLPVEPS